METEDKRICKMGLQLVKVHNPFNRRDKDIKTVPFLGQNLLQLREEHFPNELDVVISVNGLVIPEKDLQFTLPRENDQILFIPEIEGGGGKDPLRALLMIGVMVGAMLLAPALVPGALMQYAWSVPVIQFGLTMAGALIVNALLPPNIPTINEGEVSQTYGWSPQTTQRPGGSVPRAYGRNKLYGNVVSSWVDHGGAAYGQIDQVQTLYVLVHLGFGPFNKFIEGSFEINDQPILSGTTDVGYKGVYLFTRLGYLNQDALSSPNATFDNVVATFNTNQKVTYSSPVTYRTERNDFSLAFIFITFPTGICSIDDSGNPQVWPVKCRVSVRKVGDISWTVISKYPGNLLTISTARWSAGYYVFGNWYELTAGSTTWTDHTPGDNYSWSGGKEAVWQWLPIGATYCTSIIDYVTINAASKSPYTTNVGFLQIEPGQEGYYDIKVERLTPDNSSPRILNVFYLTSIELYYFGNFIYPRSALMAFKALASDQLSGSLRASCEAECLLVRVWNGATWSVEYNNNPAWVCYDVLTQPVFNDDLTVARYEGLDPSVYDFDLDSFLEWANYCDELINGEKRVTFNGVFDSQQDMWQAALKVAFIGRASIVWNGITLTIVVDKAAPPVQMFSVGNIGQDSFKETFLSLEERASEISIDFINEDNNYEMDSVSVFNSGIESISNKSQIQGFGITNTNEAWTFCNYLLGVNKYCLRVAELTLDINALAATIGDVIYIQHDIPGWGTAGGKIVTATSNTVTLDKTVTLESGKSYGIMIVLSDDTLVEKTISSPAGTYTTISVSTIFSSIPTQYNDYAVYETTEALKKFRIFDISRDSDQIINLKLIEYNENVYAVEEGFTPTESISYTSLPLFPTVTSITLGEGTGLDVSGVVSRTIEVSFEIDNKAIKRKAEVYLKTATGSWIKQGETSTNKFIISAVRENTYYEVTVVPVNIGGQLGNINNSPVEAITTTFLPQFDSNLNRRVSGLQIFNQGNSDTFVGKDCKFVWNPITVVSTEATGANEEVNGAGSVLPTIWFKDYEVKILDSLGSLRRTEYVLNPEFTYSYEKNFEDGSGTPVREFTIQVKIRDIYLRISETASSLSVTNDAPIALTSVTITSGVGYFIAEFSPSTAPDLMGYKVYASQTEGFTPAVSNIVNDGADTRVVVTPERSGTWYVRVAAYDTFGSIDLNYSDEYTIDVGNWLEYSDVELEFMKMSFQNVSWAQFALFEGFADETKRDYPEPFLYDAQIYRNSLVSFDTTPSRTSGFTSKTVANMTTYTTGTSTSVGSGYLTDSSKSWFTNECKNLTLVDSLGTSFTVNSSSSDTLYVTGTPASGSYSLKTANPSYLVAFCTYEDSTEGGGTGFTKMEVSFDDGANWQTVLDTELGVDSLEGTIAVGTPGTDYKMRFTLKNDENGDGPIIRKALVCTDPSPWRF
jgi:predicted phage tail protein